ncbi:MAG: cysteine peptidase family C39 domain-containing protein, partial [Bacilli bacterium]|nr:cysteine peptidase family C39 domain-containing protein [Bacilli bacterium]
MVYQDEKSNCGEFALRNLLRIISRSKAYYFIPFSKEITSFYDMKEELVALGYEVKCYNYLDIDSLKKKKVYIEQFKGKEENHFVVIKKTIFTNLFKVIDSGKGKYYLTKKGIKNKSNRNVLVIEKDAPEHIYLDVINKKDKLVYSVIVFFEYLS